MLLLYLCSKKSKHTLLICFDKYSKYISSKINKAITHLHLFTSRTYPILNWLVWSSSELVTFVKTLDVKFIRKYVMKRNNTISIFKTWLKRSRLWYGSRWFVSSQLYVNFTSNPQLYVSWLGMCFFYFPSTATCMSLQITQL